MNAPRFARNVLLWLLPAALVWVLITGFYNRFLTIATGNLLHLVESPNVTELHPVPGKDRHYIAISRKDIPAGRNALYTVRVTDIHYHLVLMAALFLAVPGVPLSQRLANLGLACLIALFFHLLLLSFWVQFAYATQLGSWSAEHYGSLAQNVYGLGKHLLDLPFKLALPLVLWVAFYYRKLRPAGA